MDIPDDIERFNEAELMVMYHSYLDERYGTAAIMGVEYYESDILELIDPTAYTAGFDAWFVVSGLRTVGGNEHGPWFCFEKDLDNLSTISVDKKDV